MFKYILFDKMLRFRYAIEYYLRLQRLDESTESIPQHLKNSPICLRTGKPLIIILTGGGTCKRLVEYHGIVIENGIKTDMIEFNRICHEGHDHVIHVDKTELWDGLGTVSSEIRNNPESV